MSLNNYILGPIDTDSISICKEDMSVFTKEEKDLIIQELNKLDGDLITWADDGTYDKVLILKAKNYVLCNPSHSNPKKRLIVKGSALKAPTKEPALKELIDAFIASLLNERNDFNEIYLKYVKEALNVKEINRWVTRKTLSSTTYESERTNESRIIDAIKGTEYKEGDRIRVFFKDEKTLELLEHFDGTYCKKTLLKKLWTTVNIFDTILDVNTIFKNYSLKKNQKELEQL